MYVIKYHTVIAEFVDVSLQYNKNKRVTVVIYLRLRNTWRGLPGLYAPVVEQKKKKKIVLNLRKNVPCAKNVTLLRNFNNNAGVVISKESKTTENENSKKKKKCIKTCSARVVAVAVGTNDVAVSFFSSRHPSERY